MVSKVISHFDLWDVRNLFSASALNRLGNNVFDGFADVLEGRFPDIKTSPSEIDLIPTLQDVVRIRDIFKGWL